MTPADYVFDASRYGNLARVALRFHISAGNLAELDTAYWYARYAARAAFVAMERAS